MGRKELSIATAYDSLTGESLDAESIFRNAKDASEFRKAYNQNEIIPRCYECHEKLIISKSPKSRHYFKHGNLALADADCWLRSSNLNPEEKELLKRIHESRESERHKTLKNLIGQRLTKVDGINPETLFIDNRFLFDKKSKEKRKPDVYCEFQGKKLVFEIQLSDIPLRYILWRYDFYKRNNIYLIWILDNFDVKNEQGRLEKDIKYLAKYHNYFKLDEAVQEFRLHCDFKKPFVGRNNQVLSPWTSTSVEFSQLSFDEKDIQVYYYDFEKNLKKAEKEASRKIKEEEKLRLAQEKIAEAKKLRMIQEAEELQLIEQSKREKSHVDEAIQRLIDCWKPTKYYHSFEYLFESLDNLSESEKVLFGQRLRAEKTRSENLSLISRLIRGVKNPDHVRIIDYMLFHADYGIELNYSDSSGRTALIEIFEHDCFVPELLMVLFQNGYKLTSEDIQWHVSNVQSKVNQKRYWDIVQIYNEIDARDIVDVTKELTLFFILFSLQKKQMLGFEFREGSWLEFANYCISYQKEWWPVIEVAMKEYEIYVEVVAKDKKKTFARKSQEFEQIRGLIEIRKTGLYGSVMYLCFPELLPELYRLDLV